MKLIGKILLLIGAIGTIYFGIKAFQDSDSFSAFGMNVTVSSADWTPVIVSFIVLVIGYVLNRRR